MQLSPEEAARALSAIQTSRETMRSAIWFDTYLLWLGLVMAALLLVGLFYFSAIFWWWIAIFGGGPLIATGFYIRYFWR